jgi:glycosyltransferase involved in cell wall biosynthesis
MKISGFTFIRNGLQLGYPFVQSIQSLLPLCDEVIVNVPRSTDATLEAVRAIGNPKVRIIETDWDESMRTGGLILSHHTNLALAQCTGDWCVYIQGDEVLHEDSIAIMRSSMERSFNDPAVQGLLVDYTHFYGDYWTQTCGFGWYYKEVRVVRRSCQIQSRGDAQGFRTTDGRKLHVKKSGGHYLHYGHARHPEQARKRTVNFARLWHDDETIKNFPPPPADFYDDDQKVKRFTGKHPKVMEEIVAAANWHYRSRNPIVRLKKKYFWEDISLLVNKATGLEIGVHKNYKLI